MSKVHEASAKGQPAKLMALAMRKSKGKHLTFEEASKALPLYTGTWEILCLQVGGKIGSILDLAKKVRRGGKPNLALISSLAADAYVALENLRRDLFPQFEMYQIVAQKFNEVSARVKSDVTMNLSPSREVSFLEYRTANLARCLTAYVDNHATLDDWSVTDWACALGGEVGELMTALVEDLPEEEVAREIADVIAYLDLLLARLGLDLEDCLRRKICE